jgi:hypothetical protein
MPNYGRDLEDVTLDIALARAHGDDVLETLAAQSDARFPDHLGCAPPRGPTADPRRAAR